MTRQVTLFTLLKYKKEKQENEKEIDCPVANPLDLKFNSLINIKNFKYRDCEFKLDAIEEYTRYANGETFVFTDYTLKDRSETINHPVKLRLVDDDALVLWKFESMAYNADLEKILEETKITREFTVTDDDKETTYFRVNDLRESWDTKIKKLIDVDGNGKITRTDPVTQRDIKYWDFYLTSDTNECTEIFLVEIDKSTGWLDMWCGFFVNEESVVII